MRYTLTGLILSIMLTTAFADETDDREAVMDVINAFFANMTTKDIERMQQIMTEDGVLYGYRESTEGVKVFSLTHAAYLENLAARDGVPVECRSN